MDQPSKGVGQGLKRLGNLCAGASEIQPGSQGCATFRSSSLSAYGIPKQTAVLQQGTVLSTAFPMESHRPQLQHFPPPCTQAFPSLRFHC